MIIKLIKDKINQRKSFKQLSDLISELSIDNKINKSYLEPSALEILKRIYKTKAIFINLYTINKDLYIEMTIPENKKHNLQLNSTIFIFEGIEFDYCVSSK